MKCWVPLTESNLGKLRCGHKVIVRDGEHSSNSIELGEKYTVSLINRTKNQICVEGNEVWFNLRRFYVLDVVTMPLIKGAVVVCHNPNGTGDLLEYGKEYEVSYTSSDYYVGLVGVGTSNTSWSSERFILDPYRNVKKPVVEVVTTQQIKRFVKNGINLFEDYEIGSGNNVELEFAKCHLSKSELADAIAVLQEIHDLMK